jgi:hypothetical protein
MKLRHRVPAVLLLALAVFLAAPRAGWGEVDFGVRAGEYTDIGEPFVGAELLWGLGNDLWLNPNFEYVLVDNGDYFTLNLDLHYDLDVDRPLYVWVGGGAALISIDRDRPGRDDDSETDFGLNVLGGIGFQAGPVIPYAQLKAVISDENEVVVGFGLRF